MPEARLQRAITPPLLNQARAIVALVDDRTDWADLPVSKAVAIMMKATGGAGNPRAYQDTFCKLVRETGLEPIGEDVT